MISILAPSKTMNVTSRQNAVFSSKPEFIEQAQRIATCLKSMSVESLQSSMSISQSLAEQVQVKYDHWGEVTSPAVYAYRGDVYKGFYADSLQADALAWANERVFIMSGLYGIVRLSDEISEYRLEMKQRLEIDGMHSLYEFWSDTLAQFVRQRSEQVCVLSSEEYAKPITKYFDKKQLIVPMFLDHKPNGSVGAVPIYSKMMRGVMARWIIDNRVESAWGLKNFSAHGYVFDATRSRLHQPVFVRRAMKPLVF